MKLASKKSHSKDGELCVVSRDLKKFVSAKHIIGSLREAVESWDQVVTALEKIYQQLNQGVLTEAQSFDPENFYSCLPRTWLFADGSSFLHHIRLVRKARNAPLPETLKTVPLMYQAESGSFLDPHQAIPQIDFSHGTDFEAEVGVIVKDCPYGISASEALKKIVLVTLINDISLRGLIPAELEQGFGFFQSKPTKALSPVAVTPDELGEAWFEGRVHLPLVVNLNKQNFGKANAGEMHFHFGELIAHAARTRHLAAGSLIGSGTVSNESGLNGYSCLVEKRMVEKINEGEMKTPFLKIGDEVEIFMNDKKNESIFGTILQRVEKA
jgi:fumarylacetoacetate (FAA) hydrolase